MYSSPSSTLANLHSFLYVLTPTGQGVLNLTWGGLPKASTDLWKPRLGYFLPPLKYRVPQYVPTTFLRNLHIQHPHMHTLQGTVDLPPLILLDFYEQITNLGAPT